MPRAARPAANRELVEVADRVAVGRVCDHAELELGVRGEPANCVARQRVVGPVPPGEVALAELERDPRISHWAMCTAWPGIDMPVRQQTTCSAMAEQKLFYDDVNEGDAAPEFSHPRPHGPRDVRRRFGRFQPHAHERGAAKDAGLPSVFGHGMFTMGLLGKAITDYVGVGNLERYNVRFTKQTWPGETLTARDRRQEVRRGRQAQGRARLRGREPGRRAEGAGHRGRRAPGR